jgi:hypothetical protein
VASLIGSHLLDPVLYSRETFDLWFDADISRVFDNMVSRHSNYKRSDVHPLFGLLAFPPVYLLRNVFGLSDLLSVRIVLAGVAGLWTGLFFVLLTRLGLRYLDACLFTLLAIASASAMFWLVVPETIPLGSLTMLLAVALAAEAGRRQVAWGWTAGVNVLTLGVTVTNWMAGVLAALAVHAREHWASIFMVTISVVALLTSLSVLLFPEATLFGISRRHLVEEPNFVLNRELGGPVQVVGSFLFHSLVMPEIRVFNPDFDWLHWKKLSVQFSPIGSGSAAGPVAAVAWVGLLGLGAWGFWRAENLGPLRMVLAGTILGQLLFHLVFGRETFLYSLHFLPLLVLLAAFAVTTPYRKFALALAIGLLPLLVVNNSLQFRRALDLLEAHRPPAPKIGEVINLSEGPGLMERGHPALALLDANGRIAGLVGPGGSFSPAENSFGVAIWALNENDIVLNSDAFVAHNTWQRSVREYWRQRSVIETFNYYYTASLTFQEPKRWTMRIMQPNNFRTRLAVAVRTADAARAPVKIVAWDGKRLLINDRWQLAVTPSPSEVHVGEEQYPGTLVRQSNPWTSQQGLGYAILEMSPDSAGWTIMVTELPRESGE